MKYRSSDLSLNQECSLRYIVLVMYRLSEFSHGEKCLSSISRSNEIIISFFQIPPPFCFGLCKLLMLFKCVCKGNIQWKRSQWVHVITLNTASLKWGFIWSSLQHCERRQASREICRFNIRKRRYFIKQMILLKYCSLRLRMKLVNQDQFSMDAFPFHFFANAGSVFWC